MDSDTYDKDQWRQNELIITASVFTTLSILIVSTRTFLRAVVIRKFGADDATMLVALFFAVGYFAELLLGKANNMGHAMSTLSLDNMYNIIKVSLAPTLGISDSLTRTRTRSRSPSSARTTAPSTSSSSLSCSCTCASLSPPPSGTPAWA